jgi:hypothetical protein
MRDDLIRIIKKAKEMGFKQVQIATNGVRIAKDRAYVQELKDAGLNTVYLHFDGVTTETNPFLKMHKKAIEKLSDIKKRPKDKPFSLHIDEKIKIEHFAKDIPIAAYKLVSKFWPGPLTIVLQSKDAGTIGIRMPDNEIALRIITLAKVLQQAGWATSAFVATNTATGAAALSWMYIEWVVRGKPTVLGAASGAVAAWSPSHRPRGSSDRCRRSSSPGLADPSHNRPQLVGRFRV